MKEEVEVVDVPVPTIVDVEEPRLIDKKNIAETNEATARMEKATADLKAQVARLQAERVENTLGGCADVNVAPQRTKDELADENAKKMLEGTGFGEDLFPDVT